MKIAIINYGAGNILSVQLALKRLGYVSKLTDKIDEIETADKVIFPGVGEANSAMKNLKNSGLEQLIPQLKQPVLGICLGMQLLCEHSEENDTPCLGIIPQRVKKFQAIKGEKIPHIGWNILNSQHAFFSSLDKNSYVYFVHSYFVENGSYTIASTNYIHPFSAAIQKENFWATQFHPEKSGKVGEQILQSFLEKQ